MPGDRWQQLANLRALYAYMWAHPGKKLLFMGGELAQEREWSHERSLDWHLLEDPRHAGVQPSCATSTTSTATQPALWEVDFDPSGFGWLEPNDADDNVVAFCRGSRDGRATWSPASATSRRSRATATASACRAPGRWREALNTDAEHYGGSNVGNFGGVEAEADPLARPAASRAADASRRSASSGSIPDA